MRELAIGDVLDGYRIEALLARGGMASIFRAVEVETGERVALKLPHLQYEADVVFWERFRREEEIALRLDHPGLARARAARGEKSRVYLVLELVEGESVAALLAEGRPLPPARALEIARQLCDALAYLHAQGIVHRDVKPGNVLVTPDDRVKLLDYGIAHVETARRLTVTGLSASIGTPDYMAPEQLRGKGGDASADLFALGTMLYEMLTGRLPYAGEDWEARAHAKRLDAPTPPSVHVPDLAPGVEAIVLRAIEPDVADRYATAVDLLEDLRDPGAVPQRAPAPRARGARRRVDLRLVGAIAAIAASLTLIGGIAWLSHLRGEEEAAARATAPPAVAPGATGKP